MDVKKVENSRSESKPPPQKIEKREAQEREPEPAKAAPEEKQDERRSLAKA